MNADQDFSPLEELEHLIRSWWLLVLLTLWGGAVGWLLHRTRPPLYEAQAEFYISLDFTQTGDLTQFEEDHAVSVASAIIQGGPVVDQVAAAALAEGLPIEAADLLEKGFLERRQAFWTLRLRDPDPRTAARLANLWAEYGLAALATAHRAALEAQALQGVLDGLAGCLAFEPQATPGPMCQDLSPADLPVEIQRVSDQLSAALAAGQGLTPALVFDLSKSARPPGEPVQYGRNSMVLAGGLIGLLSGIWAVEARLPQRLARVLRRER